MINIDYELDEEEKELLAAIEADEFRSVKDEAKQIKKLQEAARATLLKMRNINIRVSDRDLLRLKAKALREGLPYQTLAASILRKAVLD